MEGENKVKLDGKVAIVTGSGHGIGQATALMLAKEGAGLVIVDIDLEAAKSVARDIADMGHTSVAIKADVSKSQEANDMVAATRDKLGKVDILVNNVGGSLRDKVCEFKDATEDMWDYIIEKNLKPVRNCTRAVINHMIQRKTGKIISIASVVGMIGGPGLVDLSTAKAGVIGFTQALAKEVGRYGINVNCVSPGVTDTGRTGRLLSRRDLIDIMGGSVSKGALRRFGTPQDVAGAVSFLASDESGYVTGQNLAVCGGSSIAGGAFILGEEFVWGKQATQ